MPQSFTEKVIGATRKDIDWFTCHPREAAITYSVKLCGILGVTLCPLDYFLVFLFTFCALGQHCLRRGVRRLARECTLGSAISLTERESGIVASMMPPARSANVARGRPRRSFDWRSGWRCALRAVPYHVGQMACADDKPCSLLRGWCGRYRLSGPIAGAASDPLAASLPPCSPMSEADCLGYGRSHLGVCR